MLTAEQKKQLGPAINGFGFLLAICLCIALACKFVLSGYPPVIEWMEPFNELIIILGAALIGAVVYANNKLVKG